MKKAKIVFFALFCSVLILNIHSSGANQVSGSDPVLFQDISGVIGFDSHLNSIQRQANLHRSRVTKINQPALQSSNQSIQFEQSQAPRITLNLFSDVNLTAVGDSIDYHEKGFHWKGHIQDAASSLVVLTQYDGILVGDIHQGEQVYQIRYYRNGMNIISEVNKDAFPEQEELPDLPLLVSTSEAKAAASNTPVGDDGSVIDILIAYTPAVKNAEGGTAAAHATAELAVALTNIAYQNSQFNTQLRLVHTAETPYTESNDMHLDLSRLRGTTDGFMDELHTLRDQYGADLVAVLTRDIMEFCGTAYLMTTPSVSFASSGFGVTHHLCATGNMTFAHEVGHNLGFMHDIDNSAYPGVFPYSYGYHAPDQSFRTVMAYNCPSGCTRIMNFSNPNISHNGQATGIADAADNARSINNTKDVTANFRASINDYQFVKVSGRQLLVDFDEDGQYHPYLIKGAGYSPFPIGRHPSDWGWPQEDTRPDNIFDDAAILERDFTLLERMNANTIRIWKGQDTEESDGRFPDKLTMQTLSRAENYNLKVIAGFWVDQIGEFVCTEQGPGYNVIIDLSDQNVRDTIINNFKSFVTNFSGNRTILFWAIGNENNLVLNPDDPLQVQNWYSLVNEMAQAAKQIEGAAFHPVAVVNGDLGFIGESQFGTTDAQLPDVDIWGSNVYRGQSFGSLFTEFAAKSTKPLWIGEYGVDAWHSFDIDNPGDGVEDQMTQASWAESLWDEIEANANITIGATVMEYSDEWWKPFEWIDNGIHNATQNYFGTGPLDIDCPLDGQFDVFPAAPDNFSNEEWWGIMEVEDPLFFFGPDVMIPREIYNSLRLKFSTTPDPILHYVYDQTTQANEELSYTVKAVSPSNASISINAAVLGVGPLSDIGASFTDNGNGTGTFSWTPNVNQSGDTYIIYTAVDSNSLSDFQVAKITVSTTVGTTPVIWTDIQGAVVNQNSLLKTAITNWGNAGAASVQQIAEDGGVDFLADETTTYRMAGLSSTNANANYTSINFAVFLLNNSTVRVYENGVFRGSFGNYQSGDRFQVVRAGSTVEYKKNNESFYTSTIPSNGTLIVDSAIYTKNGTIIDARIIGGAPATNIAPVAVDDQVFATTEIGLPVTLVATDANNDTLSYSIVSGPSNGTLSGTPPNVAYLSNSGFSGNDSFTFKANDGEFDSNIATVSVTVLGTDSVAWTDIVGVGVVGNTITKSAVNGWGNGGAASSQVISANGGVDFRADETNTYRMAGLSSSNADASYLTIEYAVYLLNNGTIRIYESGNFRGNFGSYAIGDRFQVERNGTTISYKKNNSEFYTSTLSNNSPLVVDAALFTTGGTIADAKLILPGTSSNTAPVALDQSVTVDKDVAENIVLVATDADNDALTYSIVSQPSSGTLTGTAPDVTYTPNNGFTGIDSFSFKANDGQEDSNTAIVSLFVSQVNSAPVAQNQSVPTNENTAVAITLTATDADNDDLTYSIVSQPSSGTLLGTAPNVTYTPNNGFTGSDSFTFKANDGQQDSNIATVNISINNVNSAPIAQDQSVSTNENSAVSITITATDADNDSLTFSIVGQPSNGSLSGTAPDLTYTPDNGFSGSDSFTFKANDGQVDSNTATVNITVNALPPIGGVSWVDIVGVTVNGSTITKTAGSGWGNGGAASSQVIAGDGGVDFRADETNAYRMAGLSSSNANASYASIHYALYLLNNGTVRVYESGASRGNFGTYQSGDRFQVERTGTSVMYKKNGSVLYTSTIPSSGSLIVDTAIYTVNGTIADAKMIQGGPTVNIAPVADDQQAVTGAGVQVDITLVANDANNDPLTFSIVDQPANGSLSGTAPNVQYTPNSGFTGVDNFTFKANDGALDSNTATVSVIVQGSNVVIWTDTAGVSVSGNTITKNIGNGWGNAGGSSAQSISADGGVDFRADETNTYRMVGLSATNVNHSWNTIEYAVYLLTNASIRVYENGAFRGNFGSYQVGDRFSVERSGTTVTYKKNGIVFYTSTVASSGALIVDAAIHTMNGTVADAVIIGN